MLNNSPVLEAEFMEVLSPEAPIVSFSGDRLCRPERLHGLKPGVGSQRTNSPKQREELSDKLQKIQTFVFDLDSLLLESSELLIDMFEFI